MADETEDERAKDAEMMIETANVLAALAQGAVAVQAELARLGVAVATAAEAADATAVNMRELATQAEKTRLKFESQRAEEIRLMQQLGPAIKKGIGDGAPQTD